MTKKGTTMKGIALLLAAAGLTTLGLANLQTEPVPVEIGEPLVIERNYQLDALIGDDNGDGVIDEDESGWRCDSMGNLECGVTRGTMAVEWQQKHGVAQ
jgi:hypothetical protein